MSYSLPESSTGRLRQTVVTSLSIFFLTSLSTLSLAEPAFKYDDKLIKLAEEFNDPGTRYLVGRKFYRGNDYPQDKKKGRLLV